MNNDFDTEEIWDDDDDEDRDWECSVKIQNKLNKFFTARHEDCLLLTQREIEIEGLSIAEDDDVEDVNYQFHNPEPNEIETVQIRQTLSRKQVDPSSVEPTVDPFVDSGESSVSGSDVQNQDGDPPSVDPAVFLPVDYGKTPSPGSGVQNQDCDGPPVSEVADFTSHNNGAVQPQASGARGRKSKSGGTVVRSDVQKFGLKIGYDKQSVDLKMLDGRYPSSGGE